jgi:hypothetical protein
VIGRGQPITERCTTLLYFTWNQLTTHIAKLLHPKARVIMPGEHHSRAGSPLGGSSHNQEPRPDQETSWAVPTLTNHLLSYAYVQSQPSPPPKSIIQALSPDQILYFAVSRPGLANGCRSDLRLDHVKGLLTLPVTSHSYL